MWPDFLVSDFKFILAFEEIGFVWVCFFGLEGGFIFIILCDKDVSLILGFTEIGFELGLFFRTAKASFFL